MGAYARYEKSIRTKFFELEVADLQNSRLKNVESLDIENHGEIWGCIFDYEEPKILKTGSFLQSFLDHLRIHAIRSKYRGFLTFCTRILIGCII